MAGGELGEGFCDAGEELDFLLGDGAGEAADAVAFFFGDGLGAEALKAVDERTGEAGEAVAVGEDGFALAGVEGLADFGGGVLVVIEIADEGGDGALEVDVVFPEGVVGVDEEGLAGGKLGHGLMVLKSGFCC